MASLNKCMFIGNLTRDPDIRYLTNGDAVANVSIACNENYKDKNGEKKESVEFINLVFYRKLAEIVGEWCKKGQSIYIEGKMKTRSWEDKEGIKKYTTEIIVNEMKMLGSKQIQGTNEPDSQQAAPAKPSAPAKGGFDYFENVPF